MSSRGQEGNGGVPKPGPNEPADRPYPLLFKDPSPGAGKAFVDRIVALFRTTTDEREAANPTPSPVPRHVAPDGPSGRSSGADSDPSSPGAGTFAPAKSPEPRAPTPRTPEEADPEPVALHRATLQMLPGRLQPLDWKVVAQEIRFLRPTNAEQGVTLGSDQAAPPDHITIIHSSMKARHARMRYKQGEWWIESLAEEDPVRVNDRPVGMGHPRRLGTGDRLSLGEIEFRYMGT